MLCLAGTGGSNHCFGCLVVGSWQVQPPETSAVEKLLLKEVEEQPGPWKERNSPALKCRWYLRVFSLGEWRPLYLTVHHPLLLFLWCLQSTLFEDALDAAGAGHSAVPLQGWEAGSILLLLTALAIAGPALWLSSWKVWNSLSLPRATFTGLAVIVLRGCTSKSCVQDATGSNTDSCIEPVSRVKTGGPVGFFCHGLQAGDKALFFCVVGMVIPAAGGSRLAF